jgi:hypothetical protein
MGRLGDGEAGRWGDWGDVSTDASFIWRPPFTDLVFTHLLVGLLDEIEAVHFGEVEKQNDAVGHFLPVTR